MLAETIIDFEKEAAIMSKLRHPNIVQIYGICQNGSRYSIVMEFMNGSLETLLYNKSKELDFCPIILIVFLNYQLHSWVN